MKAISLWQPWASLIDLGLKTYETRSWETRHRGDLLICSAKHRYKRDSAEEWSALKACGLSGIDAFDSKLMQFLATKDIYGVSHLPFGKAIAVVTLTDCIQMTEEFIAQQSPVEIACGDWQVGRYAWKLENVRSVVNAPVKGKQGLFEVDWQAITPIDVAPELQELPLFQLGTV